MNIVLIKYIQKFQLYYNYYKFVTFATVGIVTYLHISVKSKWIPDGSKSLRSTPETAESQGLRRP